MWMNELFQLMWMNELLQTQHGFDEACQGKCTSKSQRGANHNTHTNNATFTRRIEQSCLNNSKYMPKWGAVVQSWTCSPTQRYSPAECGLVQDPGPTTGHWCPILQPAWGRLAAWSRRTRLLSPTQALWREAHEMPKSLWFHPVPQGAGWCCHHVLNHDIFHHILSS